VRSAGDKSVNTRIVSSGSVFRYFMGGIVAQRLCHARQVRQIVASSSN